MKSNIEQMELEEWIASGEGRRKHCGGGLYLSRNANGRLSWAVIYMKEGRRREHGLGAYGPKMQLREARWHSINVGSRMPEDRPDPIEQTRALRKEGIAKNITFGEVAEVYVKDVGSRKWKTDKQRAEFERIVNTYCGVLGGLRVQEVTVADVKKVLTPWVDKRPTMVGVVASVIRRVIDTAIANEWRPQAMGNPAAGSVLGKVVVVKGGGGHWPSMPWEHAPKFYRALAALDGGSARALQLLMLTALRKNEVLGLTWDEVDLDARVLRIGAARMKAGKEHVVPLSDEAMRILEAQRALSNRRIAGRSFVFGGRSKGGRMSGNVFEALMRDVEGSVHGFRATFRTWVEDMGHDAVLAEHALAHSLGDAVQKAYRRGTALERRRELMQAWSDYLCGAKR